MKTAESITWIIMLLEILLFDQTSQTEAKRPKNGVSELPQKSQWQRQASHLACKCSLGFYGRGTLVIVAKKDICKGDNGGFLGDNAGTMLKSIFNPSGGANPDPATVVGAGQKEGQEGVFFVNVEMCHSCAVGCAKCSGPLETDCSQCLPGYYANYHRNDFSKRQRQQTESHSPQTEHSPSRSKRSLLSTGAQSSEDSHDRRKLLQEEELLLTDVPSGKGITKVNDGPMDVDHDGNGSALLLPKFTGDLHPGGSDRSDRDAAYESSGEKDEGDEEEARYQPLDVSPKKGTNASSPSVPTTERPEVPANASSKSNSFDPSVYYYDEYGDEDIDYGATTDHDEHAEFQYGYDPSTNIHVTTKDTQTQKTMNADHHIRQIFGLNHSQEPGGTTSTSENEQNETVHQIDSQAGVDSLNQTESASNESPSSTTMTETSSVETTTTQARREPDVNSPEANVPFSCVSVCPMGFFPDSSHGVCVSCHPECVGCTGIGPDQCIECLHVQLGSTCVASCNGSDSETLNCSYAVSGEEALSDSDEESIPAAYYAIPPVTILIVSGAILTCYYRRYRKLKSSFQWKADDKCKKGPIRPNDEHNHVDHKKCYYKNGKAPPQMYALTDFRNSPDPIKRPGNPYVYAERPLLQKYGHHSATNSPAFSARRDMSEDEEFDPLYETPDNTLDMDALRRYHQRRRSSPIHNHHHLASALKYKEASKSKEGGNKLPADGTANAANIQNNLKSKNSSRDSAMQDPEAPYFQAPPLPVRNLPRPLSVLIEDHIYANIDESTTV